MVAVFPIRVFCEDADSLAAWHRRGACRSFPAKTKIAKRVMDSAGGIFWARLHVESTDRPSASVGDLSFSLRDRRVGFGRARGKMEMGRGAVVGVADCLVN